MDEVNYHETRAELDRDPKTVERFFVLDFDRSLANTELLYDLFVITSENEAGVGRMEIEAYRERCQRDRSAFDAANYVMEKLRQQQHLAAWERVVDGFIQKTASASVLNEGSRELMSVLADNDVPYGIMSYGGERWQRLKLEACGLQHVPTLIVDEQAKGLEIADWLDEANGTFLIPDSLSGQTGRRLLSRRITLIDDKAINFSGLPEKADGIYLQRPLKQIRGSATAETLPPGVIMLEDMRAAATFVRHLVHAD